MQRPDFDLARSGHGIRAALRPGDRPLQSQAECELVRFLVSVQMIGPDGRDHL